MIKRNPSFMDSIKRQFVDRLIVAGDIVRDEAVALIESPKSGVHYPGNKRPSSAPGEAPASQSGKLAGSIERSDAIRTQTGADVHVFSRLTRARILEAGTATKAPRPFFRPALMRSKTAIMQAMKGGVDG